MRERTEEREKEGNEKRKELELEISNTKRQTLNYSSLPSMI
jgi:hypothetical protein